MSHYAGIRGGLFEEKHRRAMGPAVWLFGWLVDRQTSQRDGRGLVLYGQPLRLERIASETGFPLRTVKRMLTRLRRAGYIATTSAAGRALRIEVLAAKKAPHRPVENPVENSDRGQKWPLTGAKSGTMWGQKWPHRGNGSSSNDLAYRSANSLSISTTKKQESISTPSQDGKKGTRRASPSAVCLEKNGTGKPRCPSCGGTSFRIDPYTSWTLFTCRTCQSELYRPDWKALLRSVAHAS